jgi:7-cyano-7-deazaguanine synthase in queuosine biosynthesis
MSAPTPFVFLCNGAPRPDHINDEAHVITLSYDLDDPNRNVSLKLPQFVGAVYHLPDRLLDLMEIAAYVFAADRWSSRGPKTAVEFHAWARTMHFVIRTRDVDFWNQEKVQRRLSDALQFMTGDREYRFEFLSGHNTPQSSMFDREEFRITTRGSSSVVLFSGGLDSLTGAFDRLQSTEENIYLISHRSGQPSIKRTQNQLVEALKSDFPGRVRHFSFECGLSKERAAEETQRTRAFLFGTIAFVLANRLSLSSFYAYENGVTSLNLLRRQDLINARASRTTHPKTHALMASFLSEVSGEPVKIANPFWQLTKTDVFAQLEKNGGRNLIGSAVSCSKTFQRLDSGTHCGCCFQCVDRRLAAYASGLQNVDNCGIYAKDIFSDPIESAETRTTAIDYIRKAVQLANMTDDQFYYEHLHELIDIVDYVDADDEQDAVQKLWQLCNRHGTQVIKAIQQIRLQHDDPRFKVKDGSLLQLINYKEYLKPEPRRLAERISATLSETIPIAFKSHRPSREDEINDHIDAMLRGNGDDFRREFPTTTFALAKVIPDHEAKMADLLIEAKFIRKGTSPSKASEGIAADITKYPSDKYILFVVYDPERGISDDINFKLDIEMKRECLVAIIR